MEKTEEQKKVEEQQQQEQQEEQKKDEKPVEGGEQQGEKKEKKSKKKKKEVEKPFTYDFKQELEELDRSALEKRINVPREYTIPKELLFKPKPEVIVGNSLRIDTVLSQPEKYFDKNALISGWSKASRKQGGGSMIFIELNDGSRLKGLQVVINKDAVKNFEDIDKCQKDSAFRVYGKLVQSQGKGQAIEMVVSEECHRVEILGATQDVAYPFPAEKRDLLHISKEQMREHAHLRIRTRLMGAIMRVRNNLAYATHVFFQSNAFNYVHTPLITTSDCEGAGEMFQVTGLLNDKGVFKDLAKVKKDEKTKNLDYTEDFFQKPAFLTVSGQLAVENYACSLSNVYTFSPTFRAEASNSTRHLAEFWMIEPELAFADNIDNMDCIENYVKFCVQYILNNNEEDIDFLTEYNLKEFEKLQKELAKADKSKKKAPAKNPVPLKEYLEMLVKTDYERITYTDAMKILQKAVAEGKVFEEDPNPTWEGGLATEHEKFLCDYVFKKPVMVYNYPKEIKAFYMKLNEDNKTVACVDMLIPLIGELVGGSQREEKLDVLEQKMKDHNLEPKDYWWYLQLRKYGTVPHSGFGVGFERLVMMTTGCQNIRDVIPFPRQHQYAEF